MTEKVFIESIKVKDGIFYNLPLHTVRMNRTVKEVLGIKTNFKLSEDIIPLEYKYGLVKCRVLYSNEILSIDFENYSFKKINQLSIVIDDNIEYPYKYQKREAFNNLSKQEKGEILIVKNGFVTDTSFSNVVFQDNTKLYTPHTYLLPGTKREKLLCQGIIHKREIRLSDMHKYDAVYLINAMIDLEDEIKIPTNQIN